MAWSSSGASTAIPSRTPPGEPGSVTTSDVPIVPATPRESTDVGTLSRGDQPQRLGDAGHLALEQRRTASGVTSVGVIPVPPVVSTTAAPAANASATAAWIASTLVGHDDRGHDLVARAVEPATAQQRARVVGPLAGGGAVGAGDHRGLHRARPLPRPSAGLGEQPDVGQLRGAIDRLDHVVERQPGRDDRVSASISTPVRSAVRVVAVMTTLSVAERPDRPSTPCSATGWHSGTRSGVRFAPAIPAMRATASASPLGSPSRRSRAITSGVVTNRPAARGGAHGDVLGRHVDHAGGAAVVEMRQLHAIERSQPLPGEEFPAAFPIWRVSSCQATT